MNKTLNLFLLACIGLTAHGCALDRTEEVASAAGVSEQKAQLAERAKPAPPPKINAETHLAAARMLEKQGDLMGAIGQYERAIINEPRSAVAYSRLGICYQKLGRFSDADQILRTGIQAIPGSAMLCNNLGYSYLIQRRYADAEQQFRDALRIAPDFPRARMNLAISLGYVGNMKDSLIEFSRVVPADIAHYNVAILQMDQGNYVAACDSFKEALAINPDCPGAAEQLSRARAFVMSQDSSGPKPSLLPGKRLAGSATEVEPSGP
ncbi:hypothetical protein B7486_08930 [cyanobacterium TDX16]|nr:hypothetical protein B7486_08930 [cyanobacterium TDX16]